MPLSVWAVLWPPMGQRDPETLWLQGIGSGFLCCSAHIPMVTATPEITNMLSYIFSDSLQLQKPSLPNLSLLNIYHHLFMSLTSSVQAQILEARIHRSNCLSAMWEKSLWGERCPVVLPEAHCFLSFTT